MATHTHAHATYSYQWTEWVLIRSVPWTCHPRPKLLRRCLHPRGPSTAMLSHSTSSTTAGLPQCHASPGWACLCSLQCLPGSLYANNSFNYLFVPTCRSTDDPYIQHAKWMAENKVEPGRLADRAFRFSTMWSNQSSFSLSLVWMSGSTRRLVAMCGEGSGVASLPALPVCAATSGLGDDTWVPILSGASALPPVSAVVAGSTRTPFTNCLASFLSADGSGSDTAVKLTFFLTFSGSGRNTSEFTLTSATELSSESSFALRSSSSRSSSSALSLLAPCSSSSSSVSSSAFGILAVLGEPAVVSCVLWAST